MTDIEPRRVYSKSRSRPSLAALKDSGYQPGQNIQKQQQRKSLPAMALMSPPEAGEGPLRKFPEKNTVTKEDFDRDLVSTMVNGVAGGRPAHQRRASRNSLSSGTSQVLISGLASRRSTRYSTTTNSATESSTSENSTEYLSSSSHNQSYASKGTRSSEWSGMSHRLFREPAGPGLGLTETQRDATMFVREYNSLAKKHGLQAFPAGFQADPSSRSVSSLTDSTARSISGSAKGLFGQSRGARLLGRLLKRTSSTRDLSKDNAGPRRVSIGDLTAMAMGRKDTLKGMHLEEIIRLGGVCEFALPRKLAPGPLFVPTSFHAAASFILAHGLTAPGLFKVPGSSATTYALYDYYQRQVEDSKGSEVVHGVSLAQLPSHIQYSVNDVAHLFKKLLSGLPGGLLGSPAVFQSLYSIQSSLFASPEMSEERITKVRARMIALAIASLNLHFRISLICAVFGLLKAVALATRQATHSKIINKAEAFTLMKEDALGIVFGPLLLGDKSDQILVEPLNERGGLLVLPHLSPSPSIKRSKSRFGKKDKEYAKSQEEKIKRAALVTEMIIEEWEEVVIQLRKIGALEVTVKEYNIPVSPAPPRREGFLQKDTQKMSRPVTPTRPPRRSSIPKEQREIEERRMKNISEQKSMARSRERERERERERNDERNGEPKKGSVPQKKTLTIRKMCTPVLPSEELISLTPPELVQPELQAEPPLIVTYDNKFERRSSTVRSRPKGPRPQTSNVTLLEKELVAPTQASELAGLEIPAPQNEVHNVDREDQKSIKSKRSLSIVSEPFDVVPNARSEAPKMDHIEVHRDPAPAPAPRNDLPEKLSPIKETSTPAKDKQPPQTPRRTSSIVPLRTTPQSKLNLPPTPQSHSQTGQQTLQQASSPTTPKTSALYSEIRRLNALLEQKTREAEAAKNELELARGLARAGVMAQAVRDAREEVGVWRNRASWAEGRIRSGSVTQG